MTTKKNAKKKGLPMKDAFKILSLVFAAILMTACSKKITFPVSDKVPAAEAVLEVEQNDNNNYDLDLQVENLARPERLTPSRRYYNVWVVTRRHGTVNLGNLEVNKKNRASFEGSTPYEPIRVFITAEDAREPLVPSTQVILDSEEFDL